MKSVAIATILLLVYACNSGAYSKTMAVTPSDSVVPEEKNQKKDTFAFRSDTVSINKLKFIQIFKDDRFNCMLSLSGDTVIKAEDHYSDIRYLDIDKDGYKDISVWVMGSELFMFDYYLFDKQLKTFKQIENCRYEITKLRGSDFYYSNERAGCADHNWESYLSKIENYKLVDYGYIFGQGCETDEQVIEIYKIADSNSGDKKLIKKLPYLKNIPVFEYKWEFIHKYWEKNYRLFER